MKNAKWVIWLVLGCAVFAGGWALKEVYNAPIGRAVMSLGFIMVGALIVMYMYSSLKK